ncbi:MAG: T9SS type A sorting domain-containing protein [Flavobacteriales bacterium]
MKKITTLFLALASCIAVYATDEVQLIVQKVNNQSAAAGNTYRVFAQMPDAQHSLHIVFGDATSPINITSTAPFYQHPYGGHSAVNLSAATVATSATLAYDSYITVGYENSADNGMWDIGVDFSTFENSSLNTSNGGWFLLPTDAKCNADARGLVLIAQFTTTGVVTGTLNLQGWTAPQEVWQKKGLTFSTTNAQTFGCTDATATNYNASATWNDGTCEHDGQSNTTQAALTSSDNKEAVANSWEIFPNPLRDDLIHIQFKKEIDLKSAPVQVDILDMQGKLVTSQIINADAVVNGNRFTITQDLAAGTYSVVLTQGDKKETQKLLVEK